MSSPCVDLKKGIPFWADGVWLPFNMQNMWGLCLIELYKATADNKYRFRALKLAETRYRQGV